MHRFADVHTGECSKTLTPLRESWAAYVRDTMSGDSQRAASERTGVSQATLSRWLRGERKPTVEAVVAFATAYRSNALSALIAAGYISNDDVIAQLDEHREAVVA